MSQGQTPFGDCYSKVLEQAEVRIFTKYMSQKGAQML